MNMLTHEKLRTSRFFMVFLASMVSLGPVAIDAYMPMMVIIAEHFQTDMVAVNLTMTAYLMGIAVGQFFGGALSDQLGRKRVGVSGLCLFSIATVGIIQSDSIAGVQIWRFIQAIGSGSAAVICLAQVRDLLPKDQVMPKYANVVLVVLLAPLFAPLLGVSFVKFGWQPLFIFLGVWAVVILLIYVLLIPETLAQKPSRFSTKELFAGYHHVITRRIDKRLLPARFIWFTGFHGGIFMTFVTNAALIFMGNFNQNAYYFAFIFSCHGLSMMAGNRVAVILAKRFAPLAILKMANWAQLIVCTALPLMLLIGFDSINVVLTLTLLLAIVNGLIMPTAPSIFISYFDKNAGAATSINTTVLYVVGASIGGLAAVLSNGDLLPIFIIVALCSMGARIVLNGIFEPNNESRSTAT